MKSGHPVRRRVALRLNRALLAVCRGWLTLVTALLALYVSLPFLAPLLMQSGLETPGRIIYALYSPFCHQFAFRSFFIGGRQGVWPRALAGQAGTSFEEAAWESPAFLATYAQFARVEPAAVSREALAVYSPALQFAARAFTGDDVFGYKLTLCERDIAIYGSMLVGAILYRRWRRWLRPAPIPLYVLLGLAPVGVDGFSQLLGYPPFSLWPARETTPAFRVMTGALFGLMNVWLGFPWLEISFQELGGSLEERTKGQKVSA